MPAETARFQKSATRGDPAARWRAPLPSAEVDRLTDEIAEVASHIDAATHRLLTLIRRSKG